MISAKETRKYRNKKILDDLIYTADEKIKGACLNGDKYTIISTNRSFDVRIWRKSLDELRSRRSVVIEW